MKRLIEQHLINWKDGKRRKPLMIRGARQVGKTYIVKQFGKSEYENFVHIDFERTPDLKKIFEKNLDPLRIVRELELVLGRSLTSNLTLVFFDEIQECPKAIMALRYFYEELPDIHIIAAGSLLEFALKTISFPVGRIQVINMFPMSFAEFLIASGNSQVANILMSEPTKLSDTIHGFLNEQLYNYFYVGGMPECVSTFIETNSFIEVKNVQEDLLRTYRLDFPKYSPQVDRFCLDTVFSSLASSVGKQIKYSNLAQDYSAPTIKKAFETLELASLFNIIPSVNPPEVPLQASVSRKKFKVVFLDIGLMQALNKSQANPYDNKHNLLGIYQGMLAEQFVGQELLVTQNAALYYWARDAKSSTAEIDYLIENNGVAVPIEVKSGRKGGLKSLHLFLEKYQKSKHGIVVSNQKFDILESQKLKFVPLYFASSVSKLT